MGLINRKGQHLAEYALIFTIVVAAIMTMQTYVKRGLQGRYRDAVDSALSYVRGYEGDNTLPLQYEPYYAQSVMSTDEGTADDPNVIQRKFSKGGRIKTTIDTKVDRQSQKVTFPESNN